MIKVAVIGSGPSGVACAHALLKNTNIQVDMLDVGYQIEPELTGLQGNASPIDATKALSRIRAHQNRLKHSGEKLPDKLSFGSNYVYKENPETELSLDPSTYFLSSLARGGLGNVWGANINALADIDIEDWPVTAKQMTPYFQLLEEIVPVAAEPGILDMPYDYELNGQYDYELGAQAAYVLQRMGRETGALSRAGINMGRARLAVGRKMSSNEQGCISCGLCMHGCPYDAIFNPQHVIDQVLEKNERFSYIPDQLVELFTELETGGTELRIKHLNQGSRKNSFYDKVYIACGSVGSTVLVARSMNWTDHAFTFLDSQKYLFPFFLNKRIKGAVNESANTLAQICAQSSALQLSRRTLHLQLYGYNALMLEPLRKILPDFLLDKITSLAAPILDRIMIGMVYLHSDDSGRIRFKVNADPDKGWGHLQGLVNERSKPVYREFMTRLNDFKNITGGRVFPTITVSNLPGNSQHFGGSLPMKETPACYETDRLGRPYGLNNTHVVDTSIFTSVPGTPPTFPAMANATRIAIESTQDQNG